MIYQPSNNRLLTATCFLYNACLSPLKVDVLITYSNLQQQAWASSKTSLIHMCGGVHVSHWRSIMPQPCLRWLVAPSCPTIATGLHICGAETWGETHFGLGLVSVMLSPLCLCAVRFLQGCPSAVCLDWICGGACCGKPTMTSWALPAHKELRSRKGAACLHLQVVNLISHCTDTSIIVIKGPEYSNLFIYWFPTRLRQD